MQTLSVLAVVAAVLAACGRAEPAPTLTATAAPATSHAPFASATADPFTRSRKEMVVSTIARRGISDPTVLQVMETVPRHLFVPSEYLDQAYGDHPLPIGYGQTISQPYIVALMTDKLQVKRGDKVLEIGTGSGYQAAVLAQMGVQVYSVEIVPQLAQAAGERLERLGYAVTVKQGDGMTAVSEFAFFTLEGIFKKS